MLVETVSGEDTTVDLSDGRGNTKMGLTQKSLDEYLYDNQSDWLKNENKYKVEDLNSEDVIKIIKEKYYENQGYSKLDDFRTAFLLFDSRVNQGGSAVSSFKIKEMLQEIDPTYDGNGQLNQGSYTANFINNLSEDNLLLLQSKIIENRISSYVSAALKNQDKIQFLAGWGNRLLKTAKSTSEFNAIDNMFTQELGRYCDDSIYYDPLKAEALPLKQQKQLIDAWNKYKKIKKNTYDSLFKQ